VCGEGDMYIREKKAKGKVIISGRVYRAALPVP